jgi:hypothetical protein
MHRTLTALAGGASARPREVTTTSIRRPTPVVLWMLAAALFCAVCGDSVSGGEWARISERGFPRLCVSGTDATSVRLQFTPLERASEYVISRDGIVVGSTVGAVGRFTDFGLRPGQMHQYEVEARDASGKAIARFGPVSAKTRNSSAIRTDYTVLAIAFNPGNDALFTEETYLEHRIQFLALASLGSARIHAYRGSIVSSAVAPPAEPGSNHVDYVRLVTERDFPGLDGYSILDLVERGDIDHVWVVKSPVDFGENALIGSRPIQGDGTTTGNTWSPIRVKCSRSFFVNAYSSDERSYDAYAHMVEGIMTSVSDGHPGNWPRAWTYTVYSNDRTSLETRQARLNLWERFRLADEWNGTNPVAYASKGNGNCGSSHFPPNSRREMEDYAYFDLGTWQRTIDSPSDDWLSYPTFTDVKRKINGYDFGAFNNYAEGATTYSAAFGASPETHPSFVSAAESFHQWWFAHLPRNPGVTDGKLNSWWPYIFDFNRFDGSPVDFKVRSSRKVPLKFHPAWGECGTDDRSAEGWGYWHSQNGFSPGGKAARLGMVTRGADPRNVKVGRRALEVRIESTQYWERWGFGRNDIFYPVSRNAHWNRANLAEVRFSIKLAENASLVVGTNPIVRLCRNGGNRIELVPARGGRYANLFREGSLADPEGWYTFNVRLAGDPAWEKNVIGTIDPALAEAELQAARAQLEKDILADLNFVEISIRSTTSQHDAPHDVVTWFLDGLELVDG